MISFALVLPAACFAAIDPLGADAGLTGTLSLGSVLVWLLGWYIPGKDKRADEREKAKDEQISTLMKIKDDAADKATAIAAAVAKEMRVDYQASLQKVVDHCEREGARRDAAFEKEIIKRDASFEKLVTAVDKMADRIEGMEDRIEGLPPASVKKLK